MCGFHYCLSIAIQFLYIQFFRELSNLISGKLIPRCNDRRVSCLVKTLCEKNLLIFGDHFVRHDVFDPEDVPDRISECLAVIAVRTCKRHLPECLFREGVYNLSNLFKQTFPEFDQFRYRILEGCFLRKQCLHLFVHLGPVFIHDVLPS